MDQSQWAQSGHGDLDRSGIYHVIRLRYRGRVRQGCHRRSRMVPGQNQRRSEMKGFVLGIVVTLAVLYPTVTKNLLSQAVDATNGAVTKVLDQNQ